MFAGTFHIRAAGLRPALLLISTSCAAVAEAQLPGKNRVDRYGDALPAGAVARLGTIRYRSCVAFLPDNKTVVSVGGSTIRRARGASQRRAGVSRSPLAGAAKR
jgi:hypothetical protein